MTKRLHASLWVAAVFLMTSCAWFSSAGRRAGGAGNQCSLTDKILFTSNRSGSYNIILMNSDGSGMTPLTRDGINTVNQHPVFTGDCKQVAWDRNGRIWLMNVDGTNARELPAPAGTAHVGHPWVGGDRRIYFVGEIGRIHTLWRMDMDGSNMKQLTQSDADRVHPSLRNDRNLLVFTFTTDPRQPGQAIKILDQTTGTETSLYQKGWPVSAATWHPDGQSVIVAEDEAGTGKYSIVQVEYPSGNRIRRLVSGDDNTIPYYDYPAGQWIDWVKERAQDRDIWRARADGSGAQALTGPGAQDTKIVGWEIVQTPGDPSTGTAAGPACVPRPATCSPNPPPCPLPGGGPIVLQPPGSELPPH